MNNMGSINSFIEELQKIEIDGYKLPYSLEDIKREIKELKDRINNKSEFYLGIDKGCFKNYKILTTVGWAKNPHPNSCIVQSSKKIYDDYIKMADRYYEYLDEQCENILEKYIEMATVSVNRDICAKIRIEVQNIYDELKLKDLMLPIEPFEYETIPIIRLELIKISGVKVERRQRYDGYSIKWTREELEIFIENIRKAFEKVMKSASKQIIRILVNDMQENIKDYVRIQTQNVRQILVDKKQKINNLNISAEEAIETIDKVHSLMIKGAITQEEFEEKKRDLLSRI